MYPKVVQTILISLGLLALAACNLEKTEGPEQPKDEQLEQNIDKPVEITGSFFDGKVTGLQYKTETQQGIIANNGSFLYSDGEIVTFYIGSIIIGETVAKEEVSMIDLTPADDSLNSPEVVNRLRLLSTLDEDGDPTNGISITESLRRNANDISFDFDQSVDEFENNASVIAFVSANSNINLVSFESALEYFGLEAIDVAQLNLDLAKASGCLACHAVDKKVVGPSLLDVAKRYKDQADARDVLFEKVKSGGNGSWTELTGGVPMPPYSPRVSDENILILVEGILQLNGDYVPENSSEPTDNDTTLSDDETVDSEFEFSNEPVTNSLDLDLARANGCLACHAVDKKVVGPSWLDVAKRYKDQADAREFLFDKVKSGGKGSWTELTGGVPMPPYSPRVTDENIIELVDGILSLENDESATETDNPVDPATIDFTSGDYTCVDLQTNKGTISVALDKVNAPFTVDNFTDYVSSGFYDETIFHRVIDNFIIQGGGYTEDLVKKVTGDPIINEANNGLPNKRGTIAAARTSSPDSAASQFYINTVDNAFLDFTNETRRGWGYAVFGQVVSGMDVVDTISKVATGVTGALRDVPLDSILLKKALMVDCSDI